MCVFLLSRCAFQSQSIAVENCVTFCTLTTHTHITTRANHPSIIFIKDRIITNKRSRELQFILFFTEFCFVKRFFMKTYSNWYWFSHISLCHCFPRYLSTQPNTPFSATHSDCHSLCSRSMLWLFCWLKKKTWMRTTLHPSIIVVIYFSYHCPSSA